MTRVRETVALVARRGYALPPGRLGELCLGGALDREQVLWAVAGSPDLALVDGLVLPRPAVASAARIRERMRAHEAEAPAYLAMTLRFVATLVAAAPFVRAVAIAGSLASGGFRASDDVDLNLVVDRGTRHLGYVAVNALGLAHALRHRGKPVDDLTRRPLAPRLMTANLILDTGDARALARVDPEMAFELLVAEPVYGFAELRRLLAANPGLLDHFPQLEAKQARFEVAEPPLRAPAWCFPAVLDRPAEWLGGAAWRYMQWTRRSRPEALARVAYVRSTMRPYALFDVRR